MSNSPQFRNRAGSDASTRSRSSSVGSVTSPSHQRQQPQSPLSQQHSSFAPLQTIHSRTAVDPIPSPPPALKIRSPTGDVDHTTASTSATTLDSLIDQANKAHISEEPTPNHLDSSTSARFSDRPPSPAASSPSQNGYLGRHGRAESASSVASFASSRGSYLARHATLTEDDLDRAARCGKFTSRPSDLFLRMYAGVLYTIDLDPLANLVSPSMIAATGVCPLSIISVIPDIVKHHADVILTAEKEVFLCTNFWEKSASSKIITDALRQLSNRAGTQGKKIVVKIMYDRGNIKQVFEPHQIVQPKDYSGSAVEIPKPEDVPNLHLEVCNYHKPALGTLHSKFLVVDRKVALINSNNIQDRCNLEMMVHLEGDIVNSFFEMALFSWYNTLSPTLTTLTESAPLPQTEFDFGYRHPHIRCKEELQEARRRATETLSTQMFPNGMAEHQNSPTDDTPGIFKSLLFPEGGKARLLAINRRLNTTLQPDTQPTMPEGEDMSDFEPHVLHERHEPFPIALVNRKPRGSLNYSDTQNPQDAAFLGGLRWAERSIFIQTPTFNAPPAVEGVLAAVRRGVQVALYLDLGFNDAAEKLWLQGGTNETVVQRMYASLGTAEEKARLHVHWYTGKDMRKPINAVRKQRNCHIKLCIIDEHVGIQGNANQDSQSWFHSQESNIMIDSAQVCQEWRAAIEANQNTGRFGQVDQDGIWRDPVNGSLLESTNLEGGTLGTLKGIRDTVRRATGNK